MVTDDRLAAAWQVLDGVLDPEVPAVSVRDLGIVRDVRERAGEAGGGLEVVLTPTYSGCPATEAIEAAVVAALVEAGFGPVRVTLQRSPAWTTDWITDEGRRRLREYGIAPPGARAGDDGQPIRLVGRAAARFDAGIAREADRPSGPQRAAVLPAHLTAVVDEVACPRCGDVRTERLSAYGSTACKALYRCLTCREPFEYFKPL